MSNVEKISIAVTPEMAGLIRSVVENGEYATTSEVIREALRDWKYKHDMRGRETDEIRRLWQEGLNSGPSSFPDFQSLKAEARRRLNK
jgi:antitoxin ParD1/3/4